MPSPCSNPQSCKRNSHPVNEYCLLPARSSFAHFSSASDLARIQAYRNHHKKDSPDYEGSYTKHICHTCLCKLSHWQGSFYNEIKFLFRVQERKCKQRRRNCWKPYMCGVMAFNTLKRAWAHPPRVCHIGRRWESPRK